MHNYHGVWAENFGIDLLSSKSLTKRKSFDVGGTLTLSTLGEFLADLMAAYVFLKSGLDVKHPINNLKKTEIPKK